MMQQVNLYTEQFRPRKTVLPLEQMLAICGGLIVVLVALSFWLSDSSREKELEALAQLAKAEALQQEVEVLAAKVGLLKQDESLVRYNQKLSEQISARERMVAILGSVAVRDSSGFSPYLIGLARQKINGLWLSGISIADMGNSLHLKGSTLQADAIPAYLRKLSDEPVFAGYAFSVFDLNADEKGGGPLSFSLQSKNEQAGYLVAQARDDAANANSGGVR